MSIGFIGNDPLNNLTNLFQRPQFIQAARIPTINDVYPPGTQWGDGTTPVQNIYETPGQGIWFLLGGPGGPLQTINNVAPFPANNINLINQGGNSGIIVTAPGSGGAGTVGLGVQVDGVTIVINGANQLQALAVSPALTLTGDNGVARAYLGNNFDFNGGPGVTSSGSGAIYFDSSANGQMEATVQVDNVTIEINPANQLALLGVLNGTATTVGAVTADPITFPMGGAATVTTFDILIAGFDTTTNLGVGYSIIGTVRTTGAAAVLVGTPDKTVNEEGGSVIADANLVVAGNNAIVRVTGIAGSTINWRAVLRSVTV